MEFMVPGMEYIFGGVLLLLVAAIASLFNKRRSLYQFTKNPFIDSGKIVLQKWVEQAEQGLERIVKQKRIRRILYIYLTLGLTSFVITLTLFKNFAAAAAIAGIFYMLPRYMIGIMDDRLKRKEEEQYPTTIRIFATQLKQTRRLERGFEAVARRIKAPVGTIFADAHFDMLSGYPPDVVYKKMALGFKSHYGFLLVQIISHIGKNSLAVDLLEDLAVKIEEHLELTREHQTRTSMDRISFFGLTLLPFPLFVIAGIYVPNVQEFFTTVLFGKVIIAITFVSVILWLFMDTKTRRIT